MFRSGAISQPRAHGALVRGALGVGRAAERDLELSASVLAQALSSLPIESGRSP